MWSQQEMCSELSTSSLDRPSNTEQTKRIHPLLVSKYPVIRSPIENKLLETSTDKTFQMLYYLWFKFKDKLFH